MTNTNLKTAPRKGQRKHVCPTCKRDITGARAEIEFLKNIGECSCCDHIHSDKGAV